MSPSARLGCEEHDFWIRDPLGTAAATEETNKPREDPDEYVHCPYPLITAVCSGLVVLIQSMAQPTDPVPLPWVVLVGDSIRLGYAPVVTRLLSGKAIVIVSRLTMATA
jgi:hypothetical protein